MNKDILATSPVVILPSHFSQLLFEAVREINPGREKNTGRESGPGRDIKRESGFGASASDLNVVLSHDLDGATALLQDLVAQIAFVPLSADAPETHGPRVEALLARRPEVAWIAVLAPESLAEPAITRMVVQRCCAWVELPLAREGLENAMMLARRLTLQPLMLAHRWQGSRAMIGLGANMQQLTRTLSKVAPVDAPVLIMGESGTGKEVMARAIHAASPRAEQPFVSVDCGALPESLVQSKLFGHVKGAFTGATERKVGLIEAANGGTVFLDKVENLPLGQQVNLLRFLQESVIEPVGAIQAVPVNVRVIAAAHQDLEKLMRAGELREDLYYRLNVLAIALPPLRERGADIVLLAYHHLHQFCQEQGRNPMAFSPAALELMKAYAWPGNVRELVNRVRRAAVMADSTLIAPRDLGFGDRLRQRDAPLMTLNEARAKAEREVIQQSLRCTGYNISASARLLNISRLSLYRLMDKYCLVRKEAT